MSPHVVIATGLYPPEIGGPATFSVFFEKALEEQGISYTTIPFSLVRHLPKGISHIVYFFKLVRSLRKGSIVLALDPVSVGFPALCAARLRRAQFFLRVGGDYAWEQAVARWGFQGLPEEFPGKVKLPLSGKVLVWTERYVAQHAIRVLTQSGHLASIVSRWGIPRERIAVVPNSISLPRLPIREEARQLFGFGEEPVIVSAGRFVPWKGFTMLIKVFSELSKEFPRARLILAGDGPEQKALKEESRGLNVQFLGAVTKERLYSLLRASDVFVLNTRYEGFSHQLLEAFAVGIPVVTTDIPGNAELVEGNTAITIPWNDAVKMKEAIIRLLSDKVYANRVAKAAHERSMRYTPERTFTDTCRALGIDL